MVNRLGSFPKYTGSSPVFYMCKFLLLFLLGFANLKICFISLFVLKNTNRMLIAMRW